MKRKVLKVIDRKKYRIYDEVRQQYEEYTYDYYNSERASEILAKIASGAYTVAVISGTVAGIAALVPER